MAVNSVTAPFFAFADAAGAPLEGGYIYIGQPGLEARTSPKASFFDVALTIPTGTSSGAAVRTMGGYPVRGGAAAIIYVDGDYSMTVTDKDGALVFSRLNKTLQVGVETTAPGLFADGNLAGVGIGFGAEPTSGLIRSNTAQVDLAVTSTPVMRATPAGVSLFQPLPIASGGTGLSSIPGGTGWRQLLGGEIMQWGITTLTAVGNFNNDTIGGQTFYTNYYTVNYPRAFSVGTQSGTVTLAAGSFSAQGSMAGLNATMNLEGDGSPLIRFTVAVTTKTLGFVPTVHWWVIGR